MVFLNWGGTPEKVSLANCPPGLGGIVYWPELKQSLYGDSWVRDEAYQEAVDWSVEQVKIIFEKLADEVEFIWEMLKRDHARKSYLAELEKRIRTWLKPS